MSYYDLDQLLENSDHGEVLSEVLSRWVDRGDKSYDTTTPVMLNIEDVWPLREYTWTRNKTRDGQWDEISESLESIGWDKKDPLHIFIGKNGVMKVGEGNHRLAISRKIGISKVPAVIHFYQKVEKPNIKETITDNQEQSMSNKKRLTNPIFVKRSSSGDYSVPKHPDMFEADSPYPDNSGSYDEDGEMLSEVHEAVEELEEGLVDKLDELDKWESDRLVDEDQNSDDVSNYFEGIFENDLEENQGYWLDKIIEIDNKEGGVGEDHVDSFVEDLEESGMTREDIEKEFMTPDIFEGQIIHETHYGNSSWVYSTGGEHEYEFELENELPDGYVDNSDTIEDIVRRLRLLQTKDHFDQSIENVNGKTNGVTIDIGNFFGEDENAGRFLPEGMKPSHTLTINGRIPYTFYVTADEQELISKIKEYLEDKEVEEGGNAESIRKRREAKRLPSSGVVWHSKDEAFEVVRLTTEKELRAEGRALGHCVGTSSIYFSQIKRRQIEIFSLRTTSGKPKFTIEADIDREDGSISSIVQIKGKGNRLPGFAAKMDGKFKPSEVLVLSEFLKWAGLNPKNVTDMEPGIAALDEFDTSKGRIQNPSNGTIIVDDEFLEEFEDWFCNDDHCGFCQN